MSFRTNEVKHLMYGSVFNLNTQPPVSTLRRG